EWIKLATRPAAATSFVDQGPGLRDGQLLTYGLAPVFSGAAGNAGRRQQVILPARPAAVPPGFWAASIDEGARAGSVQFDPAAGLITLRGSGEDIWGTADQFYALCRRVSGDFQAVVKEETRATATHPFAHAGLMV